MYGKSPKFLKRENISHNKQNKAFFNLKKLEMENNLRNYFMKPKSKG